MTAREVVTAVRECGGYFAVVDGRLCLRNPKRVSPELIECIRANRDDILDLTQPKPPPRPQAERPRPSPSPAAKSVADYGAQWKVGDRVGIWEILDRFDSHDDTGRKRKKVPKQKADSNRILVCTLRCTVCGTTIKWRYRGLSRISNVVACTGSHTAGGEIMLMTAQDEAAYGRWQRARDDGRLDGFGRVIDTPR
jgi:hypothetical protein